VDDCGAKFRGDVWSGTAKSVSVPTHRLDRRGACAKRVANPAHVDIDDVRVARSGGADSLGQLGASDDVAGSLDERGDDIEFAGRQRDSRPHHMQPSATQVQVKPAETDMPWCRREPDERADAREQFFDIERDTHKLVGTGTKSLRADLRGSRATHCDERQADAFAVNPVAELRVVWLPRKSTDCDHVRALGLEKERRDIVLGQSKDVLRHFTEEFPEKGQLSSVGFHEHDTHGTPRPYKSRTTSTLA
jgi:hypothetical protein